MQVYEPTFTGLTLLSQHVNSLNLTSANLRGYFSRDDLNKFFTTPDCIGVRIYNVKPLNQAGFIIGECVKSNGFGISDGPHLKSNNSDNPIINNLSSNEEDRSRMVTEIFGGRRSGPMEEHFSSFFLNSVLQDMLANNGFQGICFYAVPMDSVNPSFLTGNFDPTDKFTHLAIATNVTNNVIEGASSNLPFTNNFSDLPCPGHCVNLDENGQAITSPTPLVSDRNDLNGPYIPSWN